MRTIALLAVLLISSGCSPLSPLNDAKMSQQNAKLAGCHLDAPGCRQIFSDYQFNFQMTPLGKNRYMLNGNAVAAGFLRTQSSSKETELLATFALLRSGRIMKTIDVPLTIKNNQLRFKQEFEAEPGSDASVLYKYERVRSSI